jgi:predicted ferric reductase
MTIATTRDVRRPAWWWVHDIGVGLLVGFGVGTVAGLFLNRLVENNVVVLVCAVLGVIAGVTVLVQNHRRASRFLSGVVVVSWLLLIVTAGFLGLFIWAVLNFE